MENNWASPAGAGGNLGFWFSKIPDCDEACKAEMALQQAEGNAKVLVIEAGVIGTAVGGYYLVGATPEIIAAARVAISACKGNPVYCLNQVGIYTGEILTEGGIGAMGALVVGKSVKDVGKLESIGKDAVRKLVEISDSGKLKSATEADKMVIKAKDGFKLVGETTLVESKVIQPNTTVKLTENIKLPNGEVVPKGSVVTVNDNAMKVTYPDGSSKISNYNKSMTATPVVRVGKVTYEPLAKPNSDEIRAGNKFSELGYDVIFKKESTQSGVRTQDLWIDGIGKVDVYTPKITDQTKIIRAIEKKDTQTTAVLTQIDLSGKEMQQMANRVWGKPSVKNINTLFFQNSEGQIHRFDRPVKER